MKKYIVTVNSVAYEVQVEEVGETASAQAAASVPAAAPAAVPAAAPSAPAAKPAGSVSVEAPMPGTILKVNKAKGDAVKKGDILCVLEAMKMENEIMAPADGTIASVHVTEGASVKSGELLFSLS